MTDHLLLIGKKLVQATPQLFAWHVNLAKFRKQNYASSSTNGNIKGHA